MKKAVRSAEEDQLEYDFELLEIAGSYVETAILGVPPKKLNDMVEDWARGHIDYEPDEMQSRAIMAMAVDACLFQPSMSGSTPMDRFIAGVKTDDPMSRQALKVLSKSEVRWVRIVGRLDPDLVEVEDCLSGERLVFIDGAYHDNGLSLESLMRLCRLESGRYIHINGSFALTSSLKEIVEGYVRQGKSIGNPYRCITAVYKHAVREGVVVLPEIDFGDVGDAFADEESDDDDFEEGAQVSMAVAVLNEAWRMAQQKPNLLEDLKADLRREAKGELLVSCLLFYGIAVEQKLAEEEENFREICALLTETLVRQQRYGLMYADEQLQIVKESIEECVRDGEVDQRCADFLDDLLASYGHGVSADEAGNPELDKLIQSIQALQTETAEQGYTVEDAVAVAGKAAELLDRYGLDLTETAIREIGCGSVRYDTGRKRRNDTDIVCSVATRFFDCKGWLTKNLEGEIQYVNFGFRADAEAALLLTSRICDIIDKATQQFKKSSTYTALSGTQKRTAATSFQTGMLHGIAEKLYQLKNERLEKVSGDADATLLAAKEDMILEEIDRLGLGMHELPDGEAKIDEGSFQAGRQAGQTLDPNDHLG
jgi:hypothetical protein